MKIVTYPTKIVKQNFILIFYKTHAAYIFLSLLRKPSSPTTPKPMSSFHSLSHWDHPYFIAKKH